MKISRYRLTWIAAGFSLAVLSGAPAIADDTELLLLNPDPTANPKPNVLLILDTSGSMDTLVTTTAPYDSKQTYGGDCDTSAIYWTDVDVVPVCDGSNENYVTKTAFQCQYAQNQILGIGSFTNTIVQYRGGGKDGTGTGAVKWQYLASGYHDEVVECQADSGVHGDGRPTHLWAASGTNLADPFTDDPQSELSWGSSPRNIGYTFYDGNYLNWKNAPSTAQIQRIDIMKAVLESVLLSVRDMNVGLMRFNDGEGGPVIHAIQDLESNRMALIDKINLLPADGSTPLSEVLYESALYWRGAPAYFGENVDETPTDPDALLTSEPELYKQPDWDACSKNYNILLSDGEPNNNDKEATLIPALPLYDTTLGRSDCAGTVEDGYCLDDVAEYLSKVDVDPLTDGDQLVITHTIGFANDIDVLNDAAAASGGEYFRADDTEQLTRTLLDIVASISDRSVAFTAPAVSVNTFNRTRNLNDLYITMFGVRARMHWPGNLKKYRIEDQTIVDAAGNPAVDPNTGFFAETSRSFWSADDDGNEVMLGGAARELPDPQTRNLYTNVSGNNLTAATNAISTANADTFAASDFGLTGAAEEPTKDELIRWARGEDVQDVDNDPNTTVRYAMGDPLHAQPAAVVYGGTPESPDVVVYTATNDGYLHAVNGSTGEELWSFIPREFLSNLTRLYFDPESRYKQYGIDGDVVPVIKDVDQDGVIESGDGDFVYLVFGFRRGGSKYYALDVTNKNAPDVLWDVTYAELGESWSAPVVARIDIDGVTQNPDDAVVVIGGGYDTVHDTSDFNPTPDLVGAGIHFLDLETGDRLWRAGPDSFADLALPDMTRAIPTSIRVIDINGDSIADRMYASDMGGQVWRFDITSGATPANLVAGGVIARLGSEGTGLETMADNRRFYNTPDVSVITDKTQLRRFVAISVGSGYRAHPYDLATNERFYSLRDGDVFNRLTQTQYDAYPVITETDLVEVSGGKQAVITANDKGWMLTLPPDEKVLSESITFNDEVFFVSFSPDTNTNGTCAAGRGVNVLYRVSIINGDPVVPNLETLAAGDADDARRQTLQQGGIAPSPAFIFPSPAADCTGDECSPPPIACVGVECFDPGFTNNPVRTLWTQDGIE